MMATLLVAVLTLAAINGAFKAVGPALLGQRRLPPRLVEGLPAALLAGLLAIDLLGPGWREFDITVLCGLFVAVVVRAFNRPQLLCIAAGVLMTAALRAVL